jgi:hypothetical protein
LALPANSGDGDAAFLGQALAAAEPDAAEPSTEAEGNERSRGFESFLRHDAKA